jgi:hypothetical protein
MIWNYLRAHAYAVSHRVCPGNIITLFTANLVPKYIIPQELEILSIKACVTNPPIPPLARLPCTYGVFLGNFGGWPYGATTAAELQQFLFSRRRGAVQGTSKV